jgi:hypothetical protein
LPTAPSSPLPDEFQAELDSFLLSCEAENLAPKTLRTYEEAVALLGRFLIDRAMPIEPARIRRDLRPDEAIHPRTTEAGTLGSVRRRARVFATDFARSLR